MQESIKERLRKLHSNYHAVIYIVARRPKSAKLRKYGGVLQDASGSS